MPTRREIGVLLAVCGALLVLCLLTPRLAAPGQAAVITVDGNRTAVLPLSADTVYDLPGNWIVVENGACFVQEADCPDRLCVAQGRAQRAGQRIVCLPNRLMIEIVGGGNGLDAAAG